MQTTIGKLPRQPVISSRGGVSVVKGTGWQGGVAALEWLELAGPAEGMFESRLEGEFPCRYLSESVLGLSGTKSPGLAPGFLCWEFGPVPLGRAGS